MFDGDSKGILGEVYSSNFGVVGQCIDDRLDSRSGGCCLSSRRHEAGDSDSLFKLLSSEGWWCEGKGGYKLIRAPNA